VVDDVVCLVELCECVGVMFGVVVDFVEDGDVLLVVCCVVLLVL